MDNRSFCFAFGWGNNGFGGFGGNGGGYVATAATQADIQRGFDTQSIIGKLDGIPTVCVMALMHRTQP